ncbi:hypothetical protein PC120_g15194 [Phytophthora cactorum]|nr:hypothetical protein PC120_g15194 [Phytophthora cactorum]
MLFVGASKPSSYVFPLVPHAATSDLPGEKTYSQEEAILYWERLEEKDNEVEEPPAKRLRTQTRHRSSRFSGSSRVDLGCLTRSPKLSRTWGTITREDQSVGKVLTGYKDPHLPCVTPSVTTLKELLSELEYAHLLTLRGQIFKNVSGFTDASLNVDTAVLNAALAALLIHLENVATASRRRRSSRSPTFTAFMKPSIPRMLLWTENYAQLGQRAGGDTNILSTAVSQILASMASMLRTLQNLVAMQEASPSRTVTEPAFSCCSSRIKRTATHRRRRRGAFAGGLPV